MLQAKQQQSVFRRQYDDASVNHPVNMVYSQSISLSQFAESQLVSAMVISRLLGRRLIGTVDCQVFRVLEVLNQTQHV